MKKMTGFLLTAVCVLALTVPALADVIWTPEPLNGTLGAVLKISAAVLLALIITAILTRHFRKK